jgi:hypothetical protein
MYLYLKLQGLPNNVRFLFSKAIPALLDLLMWEGFVALLLFQACVPRGALGVGNGESNHSPNSRLSSSRPRFYHLLLVGLT